MKRTLVISGAVASIGLAAVGGVVAARAQSEPELVCTDRFAKVGVTYGLGAEGRASLEEAVAYASELSSDSTAREMDALVNLRDAVITEPVPGSGDFRILVPIDGVYRVEAWVDRAGLGGYLLSSVMICDA